MVPDGNPGLYSPHSFVVSSLYRLYFIPNIHIKGCVASIESPLGDSCICIWESQSHSLWNNESNSELKILDVIVISRSPETHGRVP